MDGLLEWIYASKDVNARIIKKYMPNLTKSVKNHKLTMKDFVSVIEFEYEKKFNLAKKIIPPMSYLCRGMVRRTFEFGPKHGRQLNENTFNQFVIDVLRDAALTGRHLESQLQQSLDKTCEEWEDNIDNKLFQGVSGKFLANCQTYGLPVPLFEAMFLTVVCEHNELFSIRLALKSAALHVQADNSLDINKSCWKCGKVATDFLWACSQCDVAEYCSQCCQTKAWYGGHNKACSKLGEVYDKLEESIETIKAMHKGQASERNDFRKVSDYGILSIQFAYVRICPDVDGPSMENFYANLRRISSGEWWITDKVCTTKLYVSRLNSLRADKDVRTEELRNMHRIVFFLMFDIFGDKAGEGTVGASTMRATLSNADTLALPAERFVYLYRDFVTTNKVAQAGVAWKSRRQFHINEAVMYLRDNFHKGSHAEEETTPLSSEFFCEGVRSID